MLPISRFRNLLLQAPFRDSIQQFTRLRPSGGGGYQARKFTSPTTFLARPRHRVVSTTTLPCRTGFVQRIRSRARYNSSSSKPPVQDHEPTKALGLSARFKELSRKYGWAAVGVYFALSAVDFPFCYLAVRLLGTDRIAIAEHFVVKNFWKLVGQLGLDMREDKHIPAPATGTAAGIEAGEELAERTGIPAGHDSASVWTQLLLAYGVHKSLIFFRVPLTAAVTPKVVKWLRARGWKIGKPKPPVINPPAK